MEWFLIIATAFLFLWIRNWYIKRSKFNELKSKILSLSDEERDGLYDKLLAIQGTSREEIEEEREEERKQRILKRKIQDALWQESERQRQEKNRK